MTRAVGLDARREGLEHRPFVLIMLGIGSLAMIGPGLHALIVGDGATARVFFFAAMIGFGLSLLVGLATLGQRPAKPARSQLVSLLGTFALLPLLFAVPFHEAAEGVPFFDAWFEMVSSFTTTGATLFNDPGALPQSLHLWRAMVGWLGGAMIWVAAISIFAPLNIGGFEVRSAARGESAALTEMTGRQVQSPSERLVRFGARLLPIYAGLTLALWVCLLVTGEDPFVALCHAMSVLATSGISPTGGLDGGSAGVAGEMVIFVFLIFGISRLTYSRGLLSDDDRAIWRDPEVRLAMMLVLGVPSLLFLRHYVGAADDTGGANIGSAVAAMWGGIFTVLSFLTTTGFESTQWAQASQWSGLEAPGLILTGLALVGGGVATTAGGVKLLRVYALMKHGEREVGRLIHPSSVGGAGMTARRIRRQGAYIAWVFFMLFALSLAGVMLLLALTGVQFETAMILAVASLSTTGPLAGLAGANPISYAGVSEAGQAVLAAAMVLGRLETLALVALLNPEFWRA